MHLIAYYYHVMYAFQNESTIYSCLNVKELLVWNRHDIWSVSDSNEMWTYNHLIRKQTLNQLGKQAKWLSCVVSTYLYVAFDCMLLSSHGCISEWIHILQLPECQGNPCSKQSLYLKFKWLQKDLNVTKMHHKTLSQKC